VQAAGSGAPSGLSITDVPVDSVGNVVGDSVSVPAGSSSSISSLFQDPAVQKILQKAATGAATSTLTGGDPLRGALTGGLMGGVGSLTGGGLSSILPDLTGSAGLNSAIYSAGLAGVLGGNPLMGALSSGINQGIGSLFPAADTTTYTAEAKPQSTDLSGFTGNAPSFYDTGTPGLLDSTTTTNTDALNQSVPDGGSMSGFFDSILDPWGVGTADPTLSTGVSLTDQPGYIGGVNVGTPILDQVAPVDYSSTGSSALDTSLNGGAGVLSGGGTGSSGLPLSKGQSILNQISANPGTAAFNALPFGLALMQANSQKNDISPYIQNLNNLASQFSGNQQGYLNSLTDPYDQSTGINRQKLLESLNQRGVSGSSFGDQAINNFDYTSGLGRADLLSKGIASGAQTGAGINTQAINAINARNLSSNALIGAGLNASGQLFNPVQNDQFNLKNLFGVAV